MPCCCRGETNESSSGEARGRTWRSALLFSIIGYPFLRYARLRRLVLDGDRMVSKESSVSCVKESDRRKPFLLSQWLRVPFSYPLVRHRNVEVKKKAKKPKGNACALCVNYIHSNVNRLCQSNTRTDAHAHKHTYMERF